MVKLMTDFVLSVFEVRRSMIKTSVITSPSPAEVMS